MKKDRIAQINASFVPHRLLSIMGFQEGRVDISEMLKTQIEVNAVVLRVGIDSDEEGILRSESSDLFASVNHLFALSVPAVRQFDGVIDRFMENGFQALFTNDREDGLRAAIQIRENMLKEQYRFEACSTIGLSYGPVTLGVIGVDDRVSPVTMSMQTNIAQLLQNKARRYHARILATGSLMEHVPEYALHYGIRMLGEYYHESSKCRGRIYDVFDGDDLVMRSVKRKTRLLFEKGLNYFLEREFVKARGYFIEVLKADRTDKAARNYLSLCDSYRSEPPSEDAWALCLERM